MNRWLKGRINRQGISLVLLCCLALVYLLNCFTPLRITHDVTRYLLLEDWMENGWPRGTWVDRDFLPYGYSYTLFLLSKLHLLHAFFIALLNTLFLAGALWFVSRIFAKNVSGWQWVFLVLLNWTTIKLAITPMPEMQYLFFSAGALFFYQKFRENGKVGFILPAILFFFAGLMTRTVGITLFIALLCSLVHEKRHLTVTKTYQNIMFASGSLISVIAIVYFSHGLRISDYLRYFRGPLDVAGPSGWFLSIADHFSKDWAELFVNAPSSKIPVIPTSLTVLVFSIVGLTMLGVVLKRLSGQNTGIPVIVKYYMLVYILVIFNWPYHECRFWLPLLPFLSISLMRDAGNEGVSRRRWALAAKSWYIAAGVFALSYYSYTSFNKEALAHNQDAGVWRKEYEFHFFGRTAPDSTSRPNELVTGLLKKMD